MTATKEGNLKELLDRREYEDQTLYVAQSGREISDENGTLDRAECYAVLSQTECDGFEFAAVRGPSGQIDVATFHDGCRLHQDVLAIGDERELTMWVAQNYPG